MLHTIWDGRELVVQAKDEAGEVLLEGIKAKADWFTKTYGKPLPVAFIGPEDSLLGLTYYTLTPPSGVGYPHDQEGEDCIPTLSSLREQAPNEQ